MFTENGIYWGLNVHVGGWWCPSKELVYLQFLPKPPNFDSDITP